MKTKITLMVAMMMAALTSSAMPYSEASNKALFLSDKMAYELNLTDSQLDAVYEINLDYLLNVEEESDMFGYLWEIRNRDIKLVLSDWQYNQYLTCDWFSKPFTYNAEGWTLAVNSRYNEGQFFMSQPDVFISYQGGHNQMESSFYAGQNFDKPNTPNYLGQADRR